MARITVQRTPNIQIGGVTLQRAVSDIQLTFVDESENPLEGVQVFIDDEEAGYTDEDGILEVSDVARGDRQVNGILEGYLDTLYDDDETNDSINVSG